MKRPKILHIGGSHSAHVADLVKELDKRGYSQCVFSYNGYNILPKHIPVYFFPYNRAYPDKVLLDDAKKINRILHVIFNKEKPDIIHGHFLLFSCVALLLSSKIKKLPLIITPWNITRDIKSTGLLRSRLAACFSMANDILLPGKFLFDRLKSSFGVLKDKRYTEWRLPLDLSEYHDMLLPSDKFLCPKILSARVCSPDHYQDLLIKALPSLIKKYKNLTITFIIGQHAPQGKKYFNYLISLAKKLNVMKFCTFVGKSLSQENFSKLIQQHNIVFSLAEDAGCSQTNIRSAYSGAVTIIQKCDNELLQQNKNVLMTNCTQNSVNYILDYAIKNLMVIGPSFFTANRILRKQSVENIFTNLTNVYDGYSDGKM